jgi:hypothetical protein
VISVDSVGAAWRTLGVSVCGTSHLARGTPCQDAHQIRTLVNRTVVIAVADGAGSAARSEEGSRLAVQASVEALTASLGNLKVLPDTSLADALTGAASCARAALLDAAGVTTNIAAPSANVDEFATTLLLVAITCQWIGVLQVGDGAIAALDDGGDVQILTVADGSEYLNETTFLTSHNWFESAYSNVVPADRYSGIAVMSDGLQVLATNYADNTAHLPFFLPLFRFAAREQSSEDELRSFLRSEKVCARTDDDKTLVITIRANGTVLT